MKYIDADLLKKEIERRITDNTFGAKLELIDILAWLDSLSEEPVNQSEDVFKIWGTTEKEYLAKSMDKVHLEMEISTYLKDWEDDEEIGLHLSTDNGCIPIELEDVRDLARHFAEWQASQMPMPGDTVLFNKGVAEGRRLEMEDMMKDAFVVDYVAVDDGRIELEGEPLPCLNPIILLPYPQFQPGDRVRIILIKNESK